MWSDLVNYHVRCLFSYTLCCKHHLLFTFPSNLFFCHSLNHRKVLIFFPLIFTFAPIVSYNICTHMEREKSNCSNCNCPNAQRNVSSLPQFVVSRLYKCKSCWLNNNTAFNFRCERRCRLREDHLPTHSMHKKL